MNDELGPEAHALLASARAGEPLPPAAELARLRRAVLAQAGVLAAASTLALVEHGAAAKGAAGAGAAAKGAAGAGAAAKGAAATALVKPAGASFIATLASSTGAKFLAPLVLTAALGATLRSAPPPVVDRGASVSVVAPAQTSTPARSTDAARLAGRGARPADDERPTDAADASDEAPGAADEAASTLAPAASALGTGAPIAEAAASASSPLAPAEASGVAAVARAEALSASPSPTVAPRLGWPSSESRPAPSARESRPSVAAAPLAPALLGPARASTPTLATPPAAPVAGPGGASPLPAMRPAKPSASGAAPSLLTEQLELVGRAQRELGAGRAGAALALLEANRGRLKGGPLAEEYAAAHVLALCGAGRQAEAREEAERFAIAFPRSPARARVRAACGASR